MKREHPAKLSLLVYSTTKKYDRQVGRDAAQVYLAVAIAAQAACLVTGNRAHFPYDLCQGMTVLSPSEFLAFYKEQRTTR